MTLKLTETEVTILRQSMDAVGWEALPKDHPQRRAAAALKLKLETALAQKEVGHADAG